MKKYNSQNIISAKKSVKWTVCRQSSETCHELLIDVFFREGSLESSNLVWEPSQIKFELRGVYMVKELSSLYTYITYVPMYTTTTKSARLSTYVV